MPHQAVFVIFLVRNPVEIHVYGGNFLRFQL